jgi:phosphoserine aminotransferase
MGRVFNFSAGPAVLPEQVLQQAAAEMLDWHGCGMGVMEMSHRGKDFIAIAEQAEALLRQLMGIPDNYKVLFLQGGATLQFNMLPMNLLRGRKQADYVNTGIWSTKAIREAGAYCKVNVAASSEGGGFDCVPDLAQWQLDPNAAYVHVTTNETIGGVEYHWVPDTGQVPLVADMSSHILSRPMDVSRYALIYAGAQKNIGPAGLTIVIVREDMLSQVLPGTPGPLNYAVHAEAGSMSNTPPTWAVYIAGLVFQWLQQQGGIEAMARRNQEKAALLYDFIDASSLFSNPIRRQDRSLMNVPFTLADTALDAAFLAGAEARGMVQLKGHRTVGGMRASLYNAMPLEGVRQLVDYMREFEALRG